MDFPRLCPARLLSDHNFGMCISPHDYLFPLYDTRSNYYRPWRCVQKTTKEFGSTVENDKGNYKITLDVQNFRPNEITVKVTETEIIVEGKHEERADTHGFVMRQFKRRYALPNHCPSEYVTSTLSTDGVLIIIAEKITPRDGEKIVPIKLCGASPRMEQVEGKITAETTQKEFVNKANETIQKATNSTVMQEEHSRLLKPELKESTFEKNGEKIEEGTNESTEKNSGNMGATSTILEESIKKNNLEMLELAGKMGHQSSASSSGMSSLKSASQKITTESSSYKSSTSTSSSMRASGRASEFINEVISAELREAAENI